MSLANLGNSLWRDIHFGARLLWRNPGFTSIATLTLALGIGAVTGVFSLLQGVLLTTPPYAKPERIVLISPARLDGQAYSEGFSAAQWLEWQKECKSFETISGYYWGFQFLILPDGSESVECMPVTAEYFGVTGVKPLLGRALLPSDTPPPDKPASVIVLGYNLWQRRFQGDTNVVGKVVRLSRFPPATVVGVMPPDIRFLPSEQNSAEPNYDVDAPVDYWVPAGLGADDKDRRWNVVAKLRENVTPQEAQAELSAITARQARTNPDFAGLTARVRPLTAELNRKGRALLLPVAGAVLLVLLIACANVAGLQLARELQRDREYLVRCALGAQRALLFRQVLTESLLLAVPGVCLVAVLAAVLIKAVKLSAGNAIPRLDDVKLGWAVLLFSLTAGIVASILAGFAPAFQTAWLHGAEGLKDAAGTSSAAPKKRRFLTSVAILQTALTLVLLVGAGLLIRTVSNLANVRPGYETRNILTMNVTMPDYKRFTDFHVQALARISALPGVKKVAFGWGVPLTGNSWMNQVRIEGQSDSDTGTGRDFKKEIAIFTRSVSQDYFDALGLGLVMGRGFSANDAWYGPNAVTNAPFVAIINQTMASRYFAKRNPVGSKLRLSPGIGQSAQIIGIITDARSVALGEKPEPEVYFSLWQLGPYTKHLVIRTSSDPGLLIGTVRRELRAIDPTVAVERVKTLEQIRVESVAPQTFAMRLLVGFSLVGSVLAVVGVYGVLSLSVSSRKREMAIRAAVGAQRRDVLSLVMRQGLRLVAVGLVSGVVAAVVLARVLRGFLYGVGPTDPITFLGVALLFTGVALLACLVPALRATRIDPMTALRHE